jgi:hypothetical protein
MRELAEQRDRTIETLRTWANRVGLSSEHKTHFSEVLSHAFDSVAADVKGLSDDHAFDFAQHTNRDPVVIALEPILEGRVGAPLDKVEYENALRQAKRRAEAKQPPGYRDAGKTGDAAAGDYLIWVQVLKEVRSRTKDILIVTGDAKDDWWRRERGELRGRRPELAEELNSDTGARLFMLRPEGLLIFASRILKTKVSDESLKDIERTDKYLAEALRPSIGVIRDAWEEIRDRVKWYSRVAWVLLTHATPKTLNEDVLTVEFPTAGETKGFLFTGHEKVLADAVLDVVGIRLRIAAVAQSGTSLGSHPADDTGKVLTRMELIERELGRQTIDEPSSGYSNEPPF